MLKMLLDPMGGIVLTNDGNAILREVTPYILTHDKDRCSSSSSKEYD
jgi:chaperonin GroEL (HSP60 family)